MTDIYSYMIPFNDEPRKILNPTQNPTKRQWQPTSNQSFKSNETLSIFINILKSKPVLCVNKIYNLYKDANIGDLEIWKSILEYVFSLSKKSYVNLNFTYLEDSEAYGEWLNIILKSKNKLDIDKIYFSNDIHRNIYADLKKKGYKILKIT